MAASSSPATSIYRFTRRVVVLDFIESFNGKFRAECLNSAAFAEQREVCGIAMEAASSTPRHQDRLNSNGLRHARASASLASNRNQMTDIFRDDWVTTRAN